MLQNLKLLGGRKELEVCIFNKYLYKRCQAQNQTEELSIFSRYNLIQSLETSIFLSPSNVSGLGSPIKNIYIPLQLEPQSESCM